MGISKERVCHILTEELDIRKLSARWMPRLLILDQKRIRMNISKVLLERFKRNEFLCRRFFASIHNCRNLDPPLHFRDKRTVKTVDCKG
ncbi:hypothetical protein P5V15_002666 [Pogonomyrmex californicus]